MGSWDPESASRSVTYIHTQLASPELTLDLRLVVKKCLNVRQKLGTKLVLSLNLFLHAEQLLFSWLCSKVTLSLTYSLTLSHSHSLTLSLSRSLNLSFTLSLHAEQLLFSCLGSKVTVYSLKLQWFFYSSILLV